jgi:RHS repeat-associated protein
MPSRTWSDPNTKYKYGFNGKEKDNEVNVDEGDYDFGARIYDSRLGRWLALDPLAFRFPWQSPYVAFNNNPLLYNDPTGKSGEATIDKNTKTITITSIYLFYGSGSSPAIAKEYAASIEKMYNAANGVVNIDGVDYKVQFKIIGIDISEFSNKTIQNVIGMNKDIKRNYVRLEKKTNELISGSSYTDASSSGGNTGYWSTDQIKDSKGTTPSHEHNHSLGGLDHPEHYNFNGGNFNLEPSIDMTADSYNFVKRKYNIVIKVKDKVKSFWMDITKRKVKQRNIDAFFTKAVKEQLSKTGKANIGTLSNEFH